MKCLFVSILFFLSLTSCLAAYEDARCKCVCVDRLGAYNGTRPTGKVYVKAIAADQCTCKFMLDQEAALCPYCDCKYQVRNTTTIKVIVCLILVIISALTLYMIFLLLLEPLLSARRAGRKLGSSSGSTAVSDTHAIAGSADSIGDPGAERKRWSFEFHGPKTSWEKPSISGPPDATIATASTAAKGTNMGVSWNRSRLSTEQLIDVKRDDLTNLDRPRQRLRRPRVLPDSGSTGVVTTAGVSTMVRSVRDQQQRWKGNVEAQRARVFSEHTLLN
ncbi:hypothetical protein EG68_08252 [Paragonimus skrjabini miyazakii]|uniref:Transmembrane protein 9 n=1 Tax=Paragonimus skrjabini miyazakii TaxID=59628 RepID=A0A8S9YPW0_9TREM|nr:hypothetical protein EG68_08252 [Paragonimus skrjabini miyazakii]